MAPKNNRPKISRSTRQKPISDFFSAPPAGCVPSKQLSPTLLSSATLSANSDRSRKRRGALMDHMSNPRLLKNRRVRGTSLPAHSDQRQSLSDVKDTSRERKLSMSATLHPSGDRRKVLLSENFSQEQQQVHKQLRSSSASKDSLSDIHLKKRRAHTSRSTSSPASSRKGLCDTNSIQRIVQKSSPTMLRESSNVAKISSDQKVPLKKCRSERSDQEGFNSVLFRKTTDPVKIEASHEASREDLIPDRKSVSPSNFHKTSTRDEHQLSRVNKFKESPMEETLTKTAHNDVQNERGSRKGTPGTDGEGRTPPLPYDASSGSSESSEDSSLSDHNAEASKGGWRAEVKSVILRRSTRALKSVDRYEPIENLGGSFGAKDVFGDIISKAKSSGLTVSSKKVRSLVKECQQVQKREAENNVLRENMEATTNIVGEDERGFKSLADMEKRQQDREKIALMKYSSPLHIFIHSVSMPARELTVEPDDDGSENGNWRSILATYLKFQQKANVAVSMMASIMVKGIDIESEKWSSQMASVLLNLCVFDNTLHTLGGRCYDDLLEVFLKLVRSNHISPDPNDGTNFPSLLSVLHAYGAAVNPSADPITRDHEAENLQPDSLEAISSRPHLERSPSEVEQLTIGLRNVKRAFRAAAAQLESGWGWKRAIGLEARSEKQGIISTVVLCAKILLSSFGSRLKREVGPVINAALMRSRARDWPALRWEVSKAIVTMTTRLQLHVELVTYLFPFNCERALNCTLDVAYLSLLQWGRGPSMEPVAQDVSSHAVSAVAKEFGLESISFCVGDLLELVESIPELAKDTDIVWGCGVARLLKQVLTMPLVVARRKSGQLGMLNQTIGKLRHCTHRLKYDVAVQEMRMALDALIRVLRFMGSADKASRKELYPNTHEELHQTRL